MSEVKSFFPEAEKEVPYISSFVNTLIKSHGFVMDKTIFATSVCSDEVIRSSANFRKHMKIEKSFQLGGLAGFPFAGVTGFKAFAAHIPDAGRAIILYGPHIGLTESDEIGKIHREGQSLNTTCCGTIVGVVNCLKSDKEPMPDKEYDSQQYYLTNLLKAHRAQILDSVHPLIEATRLMYEYSEKRIHELLNQTAGHFTGKTVVLLGGIIINTDRGKPDWFEERKVEILSL